MSNQLINGIPHVDNGFQSLGEVLQRASRRRDEKGNDKGDKKRIELKVTPEVFESDYKTKTITTSELCELLTNRLGNIFADYVGCRDMVFTNSPQIGIALVFAFNGSDNEHDTRLKAIEQIGL